MFEQFAQFFDTSGFMPHGHCFLWFPGLLWLTVGANAAIALAYFAIPALLTYFVYRRSDIKAGSLYLVFSAFILACGVTHVVKIWNIWVPNYWVTGIVDAATAGISIAAAWLSWKVLPLAMVFPVPAQLVEKTRALEGEVARRKQTEDELLAARNEAEDILNSISDAFFAVDRDWRLTFANKRAGEIMNVDPGQMLGRSILEKFPELVGSEFHLQYQRAMDTQQVAEFDAFYPPLEKWFHVRAYPHASGLSVYFQDITAAREAVEDRDQLFRLMPDLVCVVGFDGRIRQVNPAWTAILGYDPLQIPSRTFDELVHEEDRPKVRSGLSRLLGGGGAEVIDTRFPCGNGDIRWLSWRAVLVRERGVVLAIGRDVTLEKRDERVRDAQRQVLEQVASGTPLQAALDDLVDLCEAATSALGSVMLADPDRAVLHPASGRSLPLAFLDALEDLPVGPLMGACGTAAFRRETVIIEDARSDPLTASFKDLVDQYAVGGLWSMPILSGEGRVLGTFALYYREVRRPTDFETELVRTAVHIARLAIERDAAGDAIRQKEKQYRDVFENSASPLLLVGNAGEIVEANPAGARLFGIDARGLEGLLCAGLFGGTGSRQIQALIATAQEGRPESATLTLYQSSGRHLIVEATTSVFGYRDRPHVLVALQDVTDRENAARDLAKANKWFRELIELSSDWYWETDREHRFTSVSDSFLKLVGIEREAVIGKRRWELGGVHNLGGNWDQHRNQMERHEPVRDLDYGISLADGKGLVYVSISGFAIFDEAGAFCGYRGIGKNITQKVLAQEDLLLSAEALSQTVDAVAIADPQRQIVWANRAFSAMTGFPAEVLKGMTTDAFCARNYDEDFHSHLWAKVRGEGAWQGELEIGLKDGRILPVAASITLVRDGNDLPKRYIHVLNDISERRQAQAQLEFLAQHDSLTGLANRSHFQAALADAIGRADRRGEGIGTLFVDLDRFKQINDSLGHSAGDRLLTQVGQRLSACLRKGDLVARSGGDEFNILLDGLSRSRDAGRVAAKILGRLSQPFEIDGHELFVSASIGISCYPQDGKDVETLIKHADVAMYQAKAGGRGAYRFFSTEMNARAREDLALSNQLRQAIDRQQFLLHYQPRLELATGRITGLEALLRWQHPEHGLIAPGRFIHLAEDTGLIVPIGEQMLQSVARQALLWQQGKFDLGVVAVNLSARQFREPRLVESVLAQLAEAGLPPELLEVEVTETMAMQDVDRTVATLKKFKKHGIKVAIDDFGLGYSSLSYLKRFPIDFLKIDKSFVDGIPGDAEDIAIVRAILALARSLKLRVVAEGVETAAQRDFLAAEGCDEIQGYLFSRPLSPTGVVEFVMARDARAGLPVLEGQAS